MDVGILHVVQNDHDRHPDAEVVRKSIEFAELYEPNGFDFCLLAEHHFHGYTMSPVPFDFLSYMAGRTKRMKLGPGVIIVPWNDPYRAAAHLIMLDYLSNGRALIGLGRGLAKIEMDHFGIDMNQTRAMYDEGARKILEAVKTGSFPGGGQFYSAQNRSPMRPAPRSTDWEHRTLCVGMSPTSALEAAKLGGRLMSFAGPPWHIYKEIHLAPYKKAFREIHHKEPGPLVLSDNMFVHEDEQRAKELAYKYFGAYQRYVREFYNLDGGHLTSLKGYEYYSQTAKVMASLTDEQKVAGYVENQLWGTPKQVLEKIRARLDLLEHSFDLCALINVGDMPWDEAESVIRLMGKAIIPVVKDWAFKPKHSEAAAAIAS